MPLVRCTCLTQVVEEIGGGHRLRVQVADPGCGYVVHRLAADLVELESPFV